jgi:hypothetical protein
MKYWHIPQDKNLLKGLQYHFSVEKCMDKSTNPENIILKQTQKKNISTGHHRPENNNKPQKSTAGNSEQDIVDEYKRNLQLKNYSPNTIDIYVPFFREFFWHTKDKHPSELEYYEIHTYIKGKVQHENIDLSESKQLMAAIKFYYEKMLVRDKMYFNIGYQKEIEPVPTCLNAGVIIRYTLGMKKPTDILLGTIR